uniref:Uncharacterized protein n=1 Tax=Kalanchoe fedtschenkoi TaxID=63787 RepID=A0A7N0TW08_KALFE
MTSAGKGEDEEEDEEVFFDTVDSISESAINEDDFFYKRSEYEIWISEPQSVRERREKFILGTGIATTSTSSDGEDANLTSTADCGDENELNSDALDCTFGHENPSHGGKVEAEDDKVLRPESLEPDQVDLLSTSSSERVPEPLSVKLEYECKELEDQSKEHITHFTNKKKRNWLQLLLSKHTNKGGSKPKPSQMKVNPECIEFSAVYIGQKIKAHSGCIRAMKISPDGHYLASGGEDGVIRIWLITSSDRNELKPGKLKDGTKSLSALVNVIIPDKLFHIEEHPLHEFCDHTGSVVDIAWSKCNHLVSSSKDGTVRLWQIGSDKCLNVYHHGEPVTCAQFNPADDDYFISGSIDGKVRIWGTFKGRVTDWIDIRDVITAICYQPDGTGVVVGSSTGICRFYGYSGDDLHLQLEAQLHIHKKKKSSRNKITGIQFSPDEIQRIMITCEDSVVRILDGVNVVHSYKGVGKSNGYSSASFTSTGQHIISLDTDSRIYIWKYDGAPSLSFKKSSASSCEHFLFKDVSVAIPWSPPVQSSPVASGLLDAMSFSSYSDHHHPPGSMSDSFSGAATWPEDPLPPTDWDAPVPSISRHHSFPIDTAKCSSALSETWGLVIVTASRDGVIRTFLHNYRLPTTNRSVNGSVSRNILA